MNVGIVTVYFSENCGSVLQAYSLAKTLKNIGHDVFFISTKNKYSAHSKKKLLLAVIKNILSFNFKNVSRNIKKYNDFSKFINNFNIVDSNNIIDKNINILVFGSDTVWDVNSKYFLESQKIFWGQCFREIDMISYAASVANTSANQLIDLKYPVDCINNMKNISVRDAHSYNVISKITNKNISIVCDPTFLLSKNEYLKFTHNIDNKNYILTYLFDDLDKSAVEEIIDFARKKDLKIISVGKNISWSDENVIATISNFLSYFNNASYIITNTFHGTVFSIIFQRQFISFPHGKKKIIELLKSLQLEYVIVDDTKYIDIFNKQIDYLRVEKEVEILKSKSIEYLKKNL